MGGREKATYCPSNLFLGNCFLCYCIVNAGKYCKDMDVGPGVLWRMASIGGKDRWIPWRRWAVEKPGGGAKLMAHLMDQPKPVGVQEWTGASGALLDQPGTDAWPSQWGRGWEEGPGAWPEKSADFRQGR